MEESKRPGTDGQRRSDKRSGRRWLRWLCSPSVLKKVIALGQLVYQLVRLINELVRLISKH
jgi:hypothetical protein